MTASNLIPDRETYSLERISLGKVSGFTHDNVIGRNADIDKASAPEDIVDGGGIYVPPTQDRIHQIKSSSASDIGLLICTGTITDGISSTILIDSTATFITDGVAVNDVVLDDTDQDHSAVISIDSETQLTIENWHHDTSDKTGDTFRIARATSTGSAVAHVKDAQKRNGTRLTEFVILNGTTNVPTVNSMFRLSSLHTHGVGSNGSNVGVITATADTDATITAQINAGNGQTQMAFRHVPLGFTAYITGWHATLHRDGVASDAMADMSINSRLWGSVTEGKLLRDSMGISVGGGFSQNSFDTWLPIAQEEDFWITCESVSDDNSIISAGYNIIYVRN